MSKRVVRPKEAQRRLSVGPTKFWDDIVHRPGGPETIPGTNIPRLRLVRLGPRSVAAVEDELDAVIDGMIAERDAKIEQSELPRKQSRRRCAAAEQGGDDA